MTRKEYEERYGVKPFPSQPLDAELMPAPRQMTRAEYDAEFGNKPKPGFFAEPGSGGTFDRFMGAINKFNPAYQIPKMAIEGGKKFGEGIGRTILPQTQGDVVSGAASAAAGATQGLLAVPFGTFEAITNLPGVKQVKEFLWGGESGKPSLVDVIGDKVSDIKPLQELVTKYQNVPEVAGDLITTILGVAGAKGLKEPKLKADVQAEFQRAYDKAVKATVGQPATETTPATGMTRFLEGRNNNITNEIAEDIVKIRTGVGRNLLTEQQANKMTESARRLAETDALAGTVNEMGTIDPILIKDAINRYETLRMGDIDRGLVKNLLKQETEATNGATATNLGEIASKLTAAADRFTGSFRDKLVKAIASEVRGLSLRADELGRVKLEDIQQAKVNETQGINKDYGKLSSNAVEWKKAKANVYKTLIEQNSKVKVPVNGKNYSIKEVNAELGKYMEDIALLKSLVGRKVEGGRLGKHIASLSGNIIGYAAGSMFGPIGGAVGSAVGGEVARGIKGKQMKRTFGKDRGLTINKNAILEGANELAKKAPQTDLSIPDRVVTVSKSIPKNREIYKVEKQIKDNIESQKKAIKSGDFELVATLKEIYQKLVEHLKTLVKKIKETPNKKGGFIKNPLSQENNFGNRNKQYSNNKKATNNSISDNNTIKPYKETGNLTTKILKDLEGKTTVSKQYILDATNRGDIKQVERDLIRELVVKEGDVVNVKEFADKVKAELLPLKVSPLKSLNETAKYENITLPDELRGRVKDYKENIYESPIETSAGDVHFSDIALGGGGTQKIKNYFGHTRIEDMADNKTRRVIEVQADLYQKGNLERETDTIALRELEESGLTPKQYDKNYSGNQPVMQDAVKRVEEIKKLQQYNNPTAHFRLIREEIKKASQDSKTKLQFPTGETALRIEGLVDNQMWNKGSKKASMELGTIQKLEDKHLRMGEIVNDGNTDWIVSNKLGEGKFKALPKDAVVSDLKKSFPNISEKEINDFIILCL